MVNRIRKAMEQRDQGFTLIELLVVVIIIGILAAIAIPAFLNQREKAADAGVKSDLKNAATIAETITTDDPTSDTPFATSMLDEDNGFKPTDDNVFEFSGTPAGGNFCASGYAPNGSLDEAADERFVYQADNGGLQTTVGEPCA